MGAHAIPKEFSHAKETSQAKESSHTPENYVEQIINTQIPYIAEHKLSQFCDIFCEKSVFDIDASRRILLAAKKHGLLLKIHADEIEAIGGAGLAAEVGAFSAEHLLQASDGDLTAMAKAGTIAVLLPATSFYLDKNYANARLMIEKGIPIAIATDFNPGSSPNFNMQFVLNLACLKLKLSPEEALSAATLNAAAAINRASDIGTIEIGKQADIVLWDCPDLNFLFYRYGNNQVHQVLKRGKILC
jgi:imidazolonepropionase